MKIFVIPSVYPNTVNSNSGIYVHELNKALSEKGYEIIVLDASAFNYKNWNNKRVNTILKTEIDNIKIHSYNYRGFMTSKFPRVATFFYKKKLTKLFSIALKEHGIPDVIMSHFTFTSGYISSEISELYDIPHIVIEHNSAYLLEQPTEFIKKITTKTINQSHKFICVSNHLAESIRKLGSYEKEIKIIPNMIDDRFIYTAKQYGKEFIFFSAGNLVPNKNFDLLINSFITAFKPYERVKLIISGGGVEMEHLKKTIQKNGREHQIILTGYVNRSTMMEYYKRCNSFVLFSQYETFGIVYREALSVGRPIVSSNNGGIQEGWDDRYGILVDNLSVENCALSLKKMYLNYTKYNQKEISDLVNNDYSKNTVVNKYVELINKINTSKR